MFNSELYFSKGIAQTHGRVREPRGGSTPGDGRGGSETECPPKSQGEMSHSNEQLKCATHMNHANEPRK